MWEAVGQAISYGISSNKALGSNPLISVIAVVCFQIPFTWFIIRSVPKYRADDLRYEAEEQHPEGDADDVQKVDGHGQLDGYEGEKQVEQGARTTTAEVLK
jgi:hypothetical protein